MSCGGNGLRKHVGGERRAAGAQEGGRGEGEAPGGRGGEEGWERRVNVPPPPPRAERLAPHSEGFQGRSQGRVSKEQSSAPQVCPFTDRWEHQVLRSVAVLLVWLCCFLGLELTLRRGLVCLTVRTSLSWWLILLPLKGVWPTGLATCQGRKGHPEGEDAASPVLPVARHPGPPALVTSVPGLSASPCSCLSDRLPHCHPV